MSYQAAAAWVAGMNAASYLGHANWQLPTTPLADSGCGFAGPQNNSFGFNCSASALGSVYYNGLGLHAPNTAVAIPNQTAGPFNNFQPSLYWSQTTPPNSTGYGTFSFNTGFQGSNTLPNFLYVLPMIRGKISGTPAAAGNGLEVNPGGQTVYDPVTDVTWLANANLAATDTFGLPPCKDQSNPKLCVNPDGAMDWDSASQFIANMNADNGVGYLGQKTWQLPTVDPDCDVSYLCAEPAAGNPFGELFYNQLGLSPGTPVVAAPDIAVGPFNNIQPYLYWACQANIIQDPCQNDGPATGFEWSFSFGNGFEGTDVLANDLYVTAYFVGPARSASTPPPQINTGGIVIHAGAATVVSPGSLVDIYGAGMAAAPANAPAGPTLPTSLGGVQVLVNGFAAPLIYVSATQLIFQMPYGVAAGTASVVVVANGAASLASPVTVQQAAPEILTYGNNRAVAFNPDGSLNASGNGAPPGAVMVAYLMGSGPLDNAIPTGAAAPSSPLSRETLNTAVTVGGSAATVQFAGMTPGYEGLMQVNFVMPNLSPGDYPAQVTIGGAASNQPLVTVSK